MAHQTVGHRAVAPDYDDFLGDCSDPERRRPNPSCPVEVTLNALRGRWTALLIREFVRGERSYTDLASELPHLSDKVLSDRLAQLTSAGVLERRRTASWPPRVSYELTERGRALLPILQAMQDWGENS